MGKGNSKKTSEEAITVILVKASGDLVQDCRDGGGEGKVSSGYISNTQLMRFAEKKDSDVRENKSW